MPLATPTEFSLTESAALLAGLSRSEESGLLSLLMGRKMTTFPNYSITAATVTQQPCIGSTPARPVPGGAIGELVYFI